MQNRRLFTTRHAKLFSFLSAGYTSAEGAINGPAGRFGGTICSSSMTRSSLCLLALLWFSNCSSPSSNQESVATAEAPMAEPAAAPDRAAGSEDQASLSLAQDENSKAEAGGAGGGSDAGSVGAAVNPGIVAPGANRLIIYQANLRVKVADMPTASAALEKAVQAAGGWMSGLTETREGGQWQQATTIRVAPGRFNGLLKQLSGLGTVENKTLNTADVTAEHADITARLVAKRALEQEYLRLLKQGKKISDLLEVQEKIGEVREAIEATESRLKKLNDEVGYSTITVMIYQPIVLDTPDAPIVSLGSRLVEAVYDGWRLIVGLLIGAVTVWPLWLLGAGGWWLWKRRRHA